jgi:hypothetical protein
MSVVEQGESLEQGGRLEVNQESTDLSGLRDFLEDNRVPQEAIEKLFEIISDDPALPRLVKFYMEEIGTSMIRELSTEKEAFTSMSAITFLGNLLESKQWDQSTDGIGFLALFIIYVSQKQLSPSQIKDIILELNNDAYQGVETLIRELSGINFENQVVEKLIEEGWLIEQQGIVTMTDKVQFIFERFVSLLDKDQEIRNKLKVALD